MLLRYIKFFISFFDSKNIQYIILKLEIFFTFLAKKEDVKFRSFIIILVKALLLLEREKKSFFFLLFFSNKLETVTKCQNENPFLKGSYFTPQVYFHSKFNTLA